MTQFRGLKIGGILVEEVYMKTALIALIVITLSSCATEGKFREKLQTFEGTDISDAIEKMGPPTSVFEMPNGNKSYTWSRNGGAYSTASYNPYAHYGYGMAVAIYCNVTFIADSSNRIINWRYEGNQCVSR